MTRDVLVTVRGLRVSYPDRRSWRRGRARTQFAVNDVSFDIGRGDTLALVGESGCGKTSTARALLRIIEPDAGEIRFGGVDVRVLGGTLLRRHRQRTQIVFQDPFTSLNPRMTIAEIIAEGITVHDLASGAERDRRVARLLDEVGLTAADAHRYPHELSGGQRQRVAIARALAVDPEMLVLDEAVSALDVTTQAHILELFAKLRTQRRLTTLFIAHNLAVVKRVASHVAVMYAGRIVEQAPADELFRSPRHPYTRALIAAVPVADPRLKRVRVVVPDDIATIARPATGCPFFPRCQHAKKDDACTAAVPALASAGENRVVACVKEQA